MKYVSKFPHKIIEHANMPIIMSDGCRLSARVWMPEDTENNQFPVILEHLPYRKRDGTIVRDQYTHYSFKNDRFFRVYSLRNAIRSYR